MSRRDRRPQPDPSAPSATVAEAPRAAPETPLAGAAADSAGHAPTLPTPAAPEPVYRARVSIFAGSRGQWSPGAEVPSAVAQALLADGFTLGRELELVEV